MSGFLCILECGGGWVVEVVRRIFVSLPLFKQSISKPVLDDFVWQARLLGHLCNLFFRGRIVDVKVGSKNFQLVISNSCASTLGRLLHVVGIHILDGLHGRHGGLY